MKKIIAAIAACLIIAAAFVGCSDPLSGQTKSETKSSSSKASAATADEAANTTTKKTYTDSFDSIETYMKDQGYLTKDIIKNASDTKLPKVDDVEYTYGYEYIGAQTGKKYTNNGVVIELYAFKDADKNETVQSVKKNGTFTLFEKEITAYLACDGKYMMIYSDKNVKEGDTESDAYKTMQRAVKAFEAFKPTK
ncbi:MAG: hypothetical protein IJ725_03085 [Ruminococcus sp.]|nr:hypothetical protein [Ruminococcus sp.]